MARSKANSGDSEQQGEKSSPSAEATASTSSASTPGGGSASAEKDNISTRVGTRTKKAKIVFDPSDNYVPRKRARKTDQAESPVAAAPTSASKLENVAPKSPVKPEKTNDNTGGNGTPTTPSSVAKSRLTLSPVVAKQAAAAAAYKPKVLGAGPSDVSGRLPTATSSPVRKQEFKREPTCDMCHKVEQLRRGFKLVDCSNCAFRAHSKCLRAHPVYSKFPLQVNFRCFQCIECVVCGKSLRGGNLLFCCDCQNAFHQNCHGPSSAPHPTQEGGSSTPWVCKRCTGEGTPVKSKRDQQQHAQRRSSAASSSRSQPQLQEPAAAAAADNNADDEAHQDSFAGFSDNEIRKDSFSLSDSGAVNESLKEEQEQHNTISENGEAASSDEEEADGGDNGARSNVDKHDGEQKFDPLLDNFENIGNWSCDDVYRYFKHYFPDYAHLFREQEIDGPSLVLMRKSDVLSGFGLKLGPAISLYQRIVMMQNNDRDFRITWI